MKTGQDIRKRIFEIIEVGTSGDSLSRGYDFLGAAFILVYLVVSILDTFAAVHAAYGAFFDIVEAVIVVFFTVDYVLRLITSDYLRPHLGRQKALFAYVFSFTGIVDLLSFLPYYLPVFFPQGAVAFRMFRLIRIFRLFRINAYYDSLNVITGVLLAKKQQLISSVFIILVLMLASSLCMYSLEHEAQPEVFQNAFSGIWWSVSTLLTVGYGDIYPITAWGKVFSIILTFLGVGLVAIPTGIISAGFVEQYAVLKRRAEVLSEDDLNFIKLKLSVRDKWAGKRVKDLALPHGMVIAAVRRKEETVIPKGGLVLMADDTLIIGAEPLKDASHVDLKELVLGAHNRWINRRLKEIDLPAQTVVVLVKRNGHILFPDGALKFKEGDHVILHTLTHVAGAEDIM